MTTTTPDGWEDAWNVPMHQLLEVMYSDGVVSRGEWVYDSFGMPEFLDEQLSRDDVPQWYRQI